jgi:hypothetical protein
MRQELLRALEEAAGAAGVRRRPPDKKAEKAALQALKAALQAQLTSEEDPAVALSLAVPLLALRVGCVVCIAGPHGSLCRASLACEDGMHAAVSSASLLHAHCQGAG